MKFMSGNHSSNKCNNMAREAISDLTLIDFWNRRNLSTQLWIDCKATHSVSILLAFAAHRMGLTPNQVSTASGLFSTLTMVIAALMPAHDLVYGVVAIYASAQVSYLLDCADGQLARATQRVSEYGGFLDISIDLASIKLQFGGFFIFLYRHHMAEGDIATAQLWLFGGLAFIFFYLARFVVWQFFLAAMPKVYESSKTSKNPAVEVLKNVMDHQASVLNMLVYLISPVACLLFYTVQSTALCAAWLHYFKRAGSK